jgi:hypothetical protein
MTTADDNTSEQGVEAAGGPSALQQVAAPGAATSGPAWDRLSEQLDWYQSKSAHHKLWFQWLKVVQIIVAALIPAIVAADGSSAVAGALGAVIVILEGVQQLFQFQQNWIAYRGTAEALKHEKYLYLADAGEYAGAEQRDTLLAERVEGLVSQEHAAWAASKHEHATR